MIDLESADVEDFGSHASSFWIWVFALAAKAAPGSCFLGSTTLLNIAFGFGFSIFIAVYVAASFSGKHLPLNRSSLPTTKSFWQGCHDRLTCFSEWYEAFRSCIISTNSLCKVICSWAIPMEVLDTWRRWLMLDLFSSERHTLHSCLTRRHSVCWALQIICRRAHQSSCDFAFMLTQRVSIVRGFLYIIFQCLGACTGSAFVYAVGFKRWAPLSIFPSVFLSPACLRITGVGDHVHEYLLFGWKHFWGKHFDQKHQQRSRVGTLKWSHIELTVTVL